ncbi:MAG: hypothetical protein MI921_06950 [Cytophagales bacterium]|nr:hypothetical protein [Cytophagales bacterium]
MKSDHRKKADLLQPIPAILEIVVDNDRPSHKFSKVGGDNRHPVSVNRLTKMVHFVTRKKDITTQHYARLFIGHVFKLHKLPKVIISDCIPSS